MILSPKSIILLPLTPNLKFYANNFCQNILKRFYWAQAKIIGEENGQFTIDNSKLKILSDAYRHLSVLQGYLTTYITNTIFQFSIFNFLPYEKSIDPFIGK